MGFGIGVSGAGMGPRGAIENFAEGGDQRGQLFNRRVVTRMLKYVRPHSRLMAVAFVAMLADSGLTLLAPYLLKITVDVYIAQGDSAGLIGISALTAATFVQAVPMGEGFIDYKAFFRGLKKGGFDGTVAYEMCSQLADGGELATLDRYARRFLEYVKK